MEKDVPRFDMTPLVMKALAADDRPYEKFETKGPKALSDTELVAILLRSGMAGRNSLDLARVLLASGGLRGLQDATLEELRHVPGIGRVKSIVLKTAVELGRRMAQRRPPSPFEPITSPTDAAGHLVPLLSELDREEFHVLLLDARHRLIRIAQVSAGGLAAAVVFPRDVFRIALKANAAAIMLAHNHPSGDETPSKADIEATRVFTNIGRMMGINVLDHLIIANQRWVSMKKLGHL